MHPGNIGLLLLVPLALLFIFWSNLRVLKKLRRYYSDRNLEILLRVKPLVRPRLHEYFLLASLAFLAVALMRPQVLQRHSLQPPAAGADIEILLDLSRSMDAEDVKPSRLEQAKAAIVSLLRLLDKDRVGLMVFTTETRVAVPLTKDYAQILAILPTLSTDTLEEQGTDLAAALTFGAENLKENAQSALDPKFPSSFLVLVSDGEDTGQASVGVQAKQVRKDGIVLQSITSGTEQGGPIPIKDAQGLSHGFKKDSKGQTVITHADEKSMQAMATLGGGNGVSAAEGSGALKSLVDTQKKLLKARERELFEQEYTELYFVPLNLALLFVFLYFAI